MQDTKAGLDQPKKRKKKGEEFIEKTLEYLMKLGVVPSKHGWMWNKNTTSIPSRWMDLKNFFLYSFDKIIPT